MKRRILSLLLVLALMMTVMPLAFAAPAEYKQSPYLDARVASGELAPVAERLPKVTKLPDEILPEFLEYQIGKYGGTLRFITSVVNWDADVFVMNNEALLTMESANSDVITPNIVESYEVNDEQTEFTFKLREGLKWSDGVPVTMEDVKFTIEKVIFNEEITPVIANYMRDGGVATGDPFTFEVIDDWTFKLSFKEAYGGFVVHLSIAGWKGYTELIKPKHFLEKFHKDSYETYEAYTEAMQPYADALALDLSLEASWITLFSQADCTNWELTDPTDALPTKTFADAGHKENFPVLYPWMMVSSEGGIITWERNPYYHKVDAEGNQLPYIDKLTSTLVENMEMVQLKYVAGEADFGRESATIDNVTLYKENEAKAGITTYLTAMHVNPTDLWINFNYKDEAWQEAISDVRFLQALELSIDAEEILDSVYKGFGEINPYWKCEGDFDGANALLDEMGMQKGSDGYRTTPSGKPLIIQIINSPDAKDITSVSELYVEFWSEIGLKTEITTLESSMRDHTLSENAYVFRHFSCFDTKKDPEKTSQRVADARKRIEKWIPSTSPTLLPFLPLLFVLNASECPGPFL
ncbi:MAG: ABC transporter substrate-binding protein [Clostridiales bacterium]|nr:ABC transporter substrate-binding protein [Clostridiales bacterium]